MQDFLFSPLNSNVGFLESNQQKIGGSINILMNGLWKFLNIICAIISVVESLVEMLAIPAFFLIIGLLNQFPLPYYVVTIGGYLIFGIVIQIICHFVFKYFGKQHCSKLIRKFEKLFNQKDVSEN